MKSIHALLVLGVSLCSHAYAEKRALPPPEQIRDIILQIRPGFSPSPEQLSEVARVGLTPLRTTRTGGQVLRLERALDTAAAGLVVDRLRSLPELLWADPVLPVANQVDAVTGVADVWSGGQILLRLKDDGMQIRSMLNRLSQAAGAELGYVRAASGGTHVLALSGASTAARLVDAAGRLERLPEVLYADPVTLDRPLMSPNDSYYPNQWNYFELPGGANLPVAWERTTGSSSVVVAVVDGGVLPHPDLAGKLLPGYDMISSAEIANDGDGRDGNPGDPGNWVAADECGSGTPARASSWHGTHVAGIVGAATNNALGVAGVGWNSAILPVRVGGKCGALGSDTNDGMRWAAGLAVPGVAVNPTPARVINISLGGRTACSSSRQAAINDVLAAGAVVVVAAGNEDEDAANVSPANCNGVIAVGANNRSGDLAGYSNYGALVAIAAPGGDGPDGGSNAIGSTFNSGATVPAEYTYQSISGTSMAAPHVSGVLALMYALRPDMTPAQARAYLQASARPFAPGTWCATNPGNCGAGMLDAGAAVAALGAVQPQSGVWWNPAESGRGYMVEMRGGKLFMGMYHYADDGRATWLASTGAMASGARYQGNLVAYANGQTLTGSYAPPAGPSAAGPLAIQFSSASSGTLTLPTGTVIPIERFNIVPGGVGAPPAPFQPESGVWWNPAESGRGFSLEIQGGTLFMGGYMYDAQGNPIWYSSSGPMTTPSSYQGNWVQWGNGQTLGGSYRAPVIVNPNAGQVALNFSSTTDGTLTLPDGRVIPLTRFRF